MQREEEAAGDVEDDSDEEEEEERRQRRRGGEDDDEDEDDEEEDDDDDDDEEEEVGICSHLLCMSASIFKLCSCDPIYLASGSVLQPHTASHSAYFSFEICC